MSANRKRIRLVAESITFCVVTSSLGWLGYEVCKLITVIENYVPKDPKLLNYKAPEYVFLDKATFTGKLDEELQLLIRYIKHELIYNV